MPTVSNSALSQMYSLLSNYGAQGYGNNHGFDVYPGGGRSSHYDRPSYRPGYSPNPYQQMPSIFELFKLVLMDRLGRNENGKNPPKHNGVIKVERDRDFDDIEDEELRIQGSDDDNELTFEEIEDSKIDIRTGKGDDELEFGEDLDDVKFKVYDFSNDDKMRLFGDLEDWTIETNFDEDELDEDGGTITLYNEENDVQIKIKLDDDHEDYGEFVDGKFVLNNLFKFTGN